MKASDLALFTAIARKMRKGPPGKQGKQGRPGKPGERGADGLNGVNGRDGKDGVGIEWVRDNALTRNVTIGLSDGRSFSFRKPRDGRDGKARHGRDGVDGTGIKTLELVDNRLLVTLTSGRQIRTNQIRIRDGRDGVDGKDGTRILSGFGVPDSNLGVSGNWYLDRNNGAWWAKIGGAWERMFMPTKGVPGGLSAGSVKEIIAQVNPFSGYHINDEDSAGDVKYYGYTREIQDTGDEFYILRIDGTADPITYRYTVDGADYATAWTNRAGLTYSRLNEIDVP